MVSNISNTNIIQTTLANQAFKRLQKNSFKQDIENNKNNFLDQNQQSSNESIKDLSSGSNLTDNSSNIKNKNYVEKIKQFASSQGNNLTEQDINYAIRYGRSVLVDERA